MLVWGKFLFYAFFVTGRHVIDAFAFAAGELYQVILRHSEFIVFVTYIGV